MKAIFKKYQSYFFALLFALLLLVNKSFGQSQTFSTPGTFSGVNGFTAPAGVTSITVEVWGAGGAGGGGSLTASGGGGGGAYKKVTNVTVVPGTHYTITVGAGGIGNSTGAGPAGQASSAVFGAVTVTAGGGDGGTSESGFTPGQGGAGGTSAGGFSGGAGAPGVNFGHGGGGGSSAGPGSGSGTTGITANSGAGAAAVTGGGKGGDGGSSTGNGSAGDFPGGGGGGGISTGTVTGGNGGNGQVIISWTFVCPTVTASATSTNVLCNGTNTGQIIVSGSGGATPYTFSINNGASYQSSNTFNNLPTGTYQIRVKDNNGCESKAVQ
jgi:hypothetical protein